MSVQKLARREVIISMTVAGRSQAEIAAAINGSIRTVRRWQQEPAVHAAVAAALQVREQNALAELAKLRSKACAVLDQLLDDSDRKVQLQAVKLAMDNNVAQRAAFDDERTVALEAALAQVQASTRRLGFRR